MSGGSYDYAFSQLHDLASAIRSHAGASTDRELRLAFADLLDRCAKAAHAIEWVDSCDYGPGDEVSAINAALETADRERLRRLVAAVRAYVESRPCGVFTSHAGITCRGLPRLKREGWCSSCVLAAELEACEEAK
jgi:hypothetical protein